MRLVLVALSGLVASAAAYLSNYDSGDFFAQPTLEEIITRKRNELLDKVQRIASLIGIYYVGTNKRIILPLFFCVVNYFHCLAYFLFDKDAVACRREIIFRIQRPEKK